MSIAYLLGKGSEKLTHYKPNIPLLFVLSILPDADIIFGMLTGAEIHRGPSHSIIVAIAVFIPIFILYRKKALPYFLALISHSLIGDFFIGGQLQLFWPLSTRQFGLHEMGGPYISIYMPINSLIELSLFIAAMVILWKSGDIKFFTSSHKSNLLLIIPLVTVLLPTTIGWPFDESLFLLQPTLAVLHVFLMALFAVAIFKAFQFMYNQRFKSSTALAG
jgi:hypothetical protein